MRRTIRGRGARGFVESVQLMTVPPSASVKVEQLARGYCVVTMPMHEQAPAFVSKPSPLLCMRGAHGGA